MGAMGAMAPAWALMCALALCVAPLAAAKFEGEACTTPDHKPGVCRLIRDCPAIYAILENRPPQENIAYLNRARCGFLGNDPVLCCPGGAPPQPQQPTQPTPKPQTQPTRPAGGGSGDRPEDVSRHPNLNRFLPMDRCSAGLFDRIIGGKEADLYGHPYMARLGYKSRNRPSPNPSYRCGGSLINANYVLTAAHCVTNLPGDLRLVAVRLGEHTVDTDIDCRGGSCLPAPLDREVEETVVHPSYNRKEMQHDIALVRLRGKIDFDKEDYVLPVCLPVGAENQNLAFDNTKMTVAGWGTTESGEGSKVLLDVLVPGVSLSKCRASYTQLGPQVQLTSQQLCAGGEQGRDSCTGDSGGPLLHSASVNGEDKRVQFGVVSFGPRNCGTGGVPGIYTRVGYYMKWILDSMRP